MMGRKKHLWLSVSSDLAIDARRDLDDLGATFIKSYQLKDLPYSKISIKEGVLFATYSSLISYSRTGTIVMSDSLIITR